MATIVQPYNSWREQLAANILGPLIGNMIQRSQQNEENRKYNAMLGELATQSMNQTQTQQGSPSLMAGFQDTQPANGWEQAFRQSGSPLANFDANTAITPSVTPSNYNQADNISRLLQLLASPRFSHLSTQEAFSRANPYLQAMEAARIENIRNKYGDDLMNAADATARRNLLWGGYGRGLSPLDAVKTAQEQMLADRPQPFTLDTGGSFARGTYNPLTGIFKNQDEIIKTMTPQQIADERQRGIDNQFRQTEADRKYNLENRVQTEAERNGEYNRQPKYALQAINGKLYWISPDTQSSKPFTINGEHINAQPSTDYNSFSEREKALLEHWGKRYDELDKKENTLREQMLNETDQRAKSDLNSQIKQIQQDKKQIWDAINQRIQTPPAQAQTQNQTQTQTPNNNNSGSQSLGARLIGNANGGRITGHFLEDRGDHEHGGTDFPAQAGTPIKIDSAMGNNLRVVRACTNPKDPSNFGCHVRLEGVINGQKFGFILAHMKEGSIKVKAGDILKAGDVIGQVGSTGRSSGNHLHLEIHKGGLGGQKIDPETFMKTYGNQQQQTGNVMPQPEQPANTQAPQAKTQSNSPVAWRHSKYNNYTMTQEQYENTVKKAEAGEIENAHSRAEVDKVLEDNGYVREAQAPTVMPATVSPELDWRPSYQKVAPPQAMTSPTPVNNAPSVMPATEAPEEMPEQQQAQLDHLNGLENNYWGVFQQPYNFGTIFDDNPNSPYNRLRNRYLERYSFI